MTVTSIIEGPATDRRVQRSRRLLKQALLDLVLEKHYDDITVQDVLERADIGRSTFYSHFRNKDELLMGDLPSLEWLGDPEPPALLPSMVPLFAHFADNYHLFKALAGTTGVQVMLGTLTRAFTADWTRRLEAAGRGDGAGSEARFLAGGFIELASWWLHAEMPIPPAEAGRRFDRMAAGALTSARLPGA
jgi:hypothetical protein